MSPRIVTHRVSVKASRLALPPKRAPVPDARMPPNGAFGVVVHRLVVDVHDAGGDLPASSSPRMTSRVRMPERQAVLGVGGQLGRVVRGAEPHDGRHRAEDLARRTRAWPARRRPAPWAGRTAPRSVPPAASRAPASTRAGHQRVHLVPLPLVDDRPERHLTRGRVADRQVAGLLGEPADVVVVDPLVHDVPPGRHADLALVQERSPRARRRRLVQVGVVQHDQRRVAAEFEVHALEVLSGERADLAAGRGRAGERDHARPRGSVTSASPASGAAGQHVQQPLGQPGLLEDRGRARRRRRRRCAGLA